MNRLSPVARFVIYIVAIILIQRLLSMLLLALGINGVAYLIVFELIVAFLFAFLNYPGDKKGFIKDPKFHKMFAIFFAVLIGLQVLF